MKLSVILPAFNEEAVIGDVIERLEKEFSGEAEIIVVNDGSGDRTAEIAAEKGAKVISHAYNIGNGAAVKTGIRHATGDVIVLMDADGQHDVNDIKNLLQFIPEYDMVVGARDASSEVKWHRKWANRIYNLFASYVTHFKVQDLTSGFRAIKRPEAMKFLYLLPNTFSYPTTITLAFLRAGRSVKYVPIKTYYRVGKSKIKLFSDGIRFFFILTKIATLFSPFRIFLPVSTFFATLGFGYYLYTFITVHRFTNMAMLLIMTGVIIFMMGLIAEQIAQLRFSQSEVEYPAAGWPQNHVTPATANGGRKRAASGKSKPAAAPVKKGASRK